MSTRRVAKLLIYEGEDAAMDRHLAQAKADGKQHVGFNEAESVSLRIITLPPGFLTMLDEIGIMHQTEAVKEALGK